jgi:hypothetical protein
VRTSRVLVFLRALAGWAWFAYAVFYLFLAEPHPRGNELHINLIHAFVIERDWHDRVQLQFEIVGAAVATLAVMTRPPSRPTERSAN